MSILSILGTLLVDGLIIFVLIESVHYLVYGWYIPEKELDVYLGKYLDKTTLNPYSNGSILTDMPKYISTSNSFTSKWHISDYGLIPRWSKWSARIDARRKELIAASPQLEKKKLSQL